MIFAKPSNSTIDWRREGRAAMVAIILTSVAVIFFFKLWRAHPHVPLLYSGDGLLTISGLRNMRFSGWYYSTRHLGFPLGQDLHDFPALGDNLHLSILWILIKLFRDEVVAFNFYFLATYPLVALTTYCSSRILGLKRTTSIVVAILYAFLPFHFLQGPGHLYLAAYWSVPLASAFLVRQLSGSPIAGHPTNFSVSAIGKWLRSWGVATTIVVGVLTAATGFYFGFFLFVLAGLTCIVHVINKDERKLLPSAILLGGSSALSLGAQFLPIWLFEREHGNVLSMVARSLAATEFYSLKIVDLILPMPGHRIGSWSALRDRASAVYLTGENSMAIGIVGTVGLVCLLLYPLLKRKTGSRVFTSGLPVFVFLSIALASVGGLGQLVATFGFTQIRVWSRMSVFIGFGAFVFFGYLFERWTASLRPRQITILLALPLAIGMADSTRSQMLADYKITARAWELDRDLVRQIELKVGPQAKILQLPYVPFPENPPVVGMEDYDHLRGYVHSKTLFWSYGWIKGRPGDPSIGLDPLVPGFRVNFTSSGFDAIWLNRHGYLDNGQGAITELEHQGFKLLLEANSTVVFVPS